MTLEKLNGYFRLLAQLNRAREMLASLEVAATPRSPQLDGMPHTPGSGDRVGELTAEITDMRDRVEALAEDTGQKRREIESYVDGIQDDQARHIFRLRFLRGLSWGEVAAIIGGGNTENSVKCICYRYLHKENLQRSDAP